MKYKIVAIHRPCIEDHLHGLYSDTSCSCSAQWLATQSYRTCPQLFPQRLDGIISVRRHIAHANHWYTIGAPFRFFLQTDDPTRPRHARLLAFPVPRHERLFTQSRLPRFCDPQRFTLKRTTCRAL